MNLTFFIINYKTDIQTKTCIESIRSMETAPTDNVCIHVFDNSEKSNLEANEFEKSLSGAAQTTFCNGNLGYFGCLQLAQEKVPVDSDYIVYANPDLFFHSDFLTELKKIETEATLIAPSIISKNDKFDQNPKYKSRLRKSKLERLKRIHSNDITYTLFHATANFAEKLRPNPKQQTPGAGETIYALHGSAIIFKECEFFKSLPLYPCFLFGEELFIAEEAIRAKAKTEYHPNLKITDYRHGNISALPRRHHREYMYTSINHIMQTYYR
jgi:GT2 family glycosyltransferase